MSRLLLVRVGSRLCGLSIAHVRETMRPLPIEAIPGLPSFVLGTALIRGAATPVVDLGALLGERSDREGHRFVTLDVEPDRRVALLVDEVLGVSQHPGASELPPLLQDALRESVEAIARLDARLLTVLHTARLLPEALR